MSDLDKRVEAHLKYAVMIDGGSAELINDLHTENKRLREALEKISDFHWAKSDIKFPHNINTLRKIAEKALRKAIEQDKLAEGQEMLEALNRSFCPVCNKEPFNGKSGECGHAEKGDKSVKDKHPTCPFCLGNDRNVPCAYPSEGREGCLRDIRLRDEQQEPVAWISSDRLMVQMGRPQGEWGEDYSPLYTSPPRRELSDDEIYKMIQKAKKDLPAYISGESITLRDIAYVRALLKAQQEVKP